MSTTSATVAPEVRLFLAKVRAQLADLDPDEVAEITDGLEADLGELVAERGPSSLGDPVEYAGELRLAAGIPDRAGVSARRRPGARIAGAMDQVHQRFDAVVARYLPEPAPILAWARPTWWLLRAWVALQVAQGLMDLLDLLPDGRSEYRAIMPYWHGLEWVVLAIAILGSVQIGRGRWWPGRQSEGRRGLPSRVILMGLNVLAVGLLPWAVSAISSQDAYQRGVGYGFMAGLRDGQAQFEQPSVDEVPRQAGIYSDGRWVSQIFPYDAAGKPLTGVQLFDQTGEPISVVTQPECENTGALAPLATDQETGSGCHGYDSSMDREVELKVKIYYPWTNGAAQLYNTFPLVSRYQDSGALSATAFAEKEKPTVGTLPFATVPPISLPGIATSTVVAPKSPKSPKSPAVK